LQATQKSMHKCILEVYHKLNEMHSQTATPVHLMIDGNYFNPLYVKPQNRIDNILLPYSTVEKGDGLYANIAAASILAKTARDNYIVNELCKSQPELIERYQIDQNMGYGSKRHLDGIRAYGISSLHRKTFGICSKYCNNIGINSTLLDVELRETLKKQDADHFEKHKPAPKRLPKQKAIKNKNVITAPISSEPTETNITHILEGSNSDENGNGKGKGKGKKSNKNMKYTETIKKIKEISNNTKDILDECKRLIKELNQMTPEGNLNFDMLNAKLNDSTTILTHHFEK
jgi:ribonuclease HII